MNDSQHFLHSFWFVCALVFIIITIDVGVIFIPVPQGGQKYADILIGGLNTGGLMTGIQWLLGGNPLAKKADSTVVQSGPDAITNVAPVDEKG